MLNGIGWIIVAGNIMVGNFGIAAILAVLLAVTQ